jgi:predicted HicB family RNase H-like nuclease
MILTSLLEIGDNRMNNLPDCKKCVHEMACAFPVENCTPKLSEDKIKIQQLEANIVQIEKENKRLLLMAHQRVDKYQEEIYSLEFNCQSKQKTINIQIEIIEELKQENQRLQEQIAQMQKQGAEEYGEEYYSKLCARLDEVIYENTELKAQIAQLNEHEMDYQQMKYLNESLREQIAQLQEEYDHDMDMYGSAIKNFRETQLKLVKQNEQMKNCQNCHHEGKDSCQFCEGGCDSCENICFNCIRYEKDRSGTIKTMKDNWQLKEADK